MKKSNLNIANSYMYTKLLLLILCIITIIFIGCKVSANTNQTYKDVYIISDDKILDAKTYKDVYITSSNKIIKL